MMSDERNEFDMMDEEDDAPTDRLSAAAVGLDTDPLHAAVIDADLAERIARDYAPTLDEERLTFVARIEADGRVTIPERYLTSGALRRGEEVLILVKKMGS